MKVWSHFCFRLRLPAIWGKITRGIQIFYQNLCYSSLLSLFCCSSLCEKCKTCVCTRNLNYHQGTPGPPKWAEIVDLIMFSPAKNLIPKNFSEKRVTFIRKSRKKWKIALKSRFFRFFVIFRDFWINATLFSEKFFGIGFFGWTKHHQIYDSSLFRWPWRALMVIWVGVYTRRFCTFSHKDEQQNRDE